jgi:hypothetical protein
MVSKRRATKGERDKHPKEAKRVYAWVEYGGKFREEATSRRYR